MNLDSLILAQILREQMKKLFIIGAGRSATTMIDYLLAHAEAEDWMVTVGDFQEALAIEKAGGHPRGRAIQFDVTNAEQRHREVEDADLVISLLPPHMHVIVARECLVANTNLLTASYVSPEMKELDAEAKAKGLLFLNEMGVDPGIDHMSAMEMIDRIRDKGGEISSFRSYCGALIAPESTNMWGYKFTWAPRNIILAGTGGVAIYRRGGTTKYLPYHHIFARTEEITVPKYGKFEAYANRDSVSYAPKYGLDKADTLLRATLRLPGFCRMWQAFIEIGLTDNSFRIPNSEGMSYRDFVFSFINEKPGLSDRETLAFFLEVPSDGPVIQKIEALDLLSHEAKISLKNASPADILEHILIEKWKLEAEDVDMVVMQHKIEYVLNGVHHRLVSSMVDKGKDTLNTAISRTVGLPAAIGAKLILQDKVSLRGVQIPISKELYDPILEELESFNIRFVEEEFLVPKPAAKV